MHLLNLAHNHLTKKQAARLAQPAQLLPFTSVCVSLFGFGIWPWSCALATMVAAVLHKPPPSGYCCRRCKDGLGHGLFCTKAPAFQMLRDAIGTDTCVGTKVF